MPEIMATRVWMANARTGPDGVEGRLVLEDSRLLFRPAGGADSTEIDLAKVRRVHRVLGSPVLEVRLRGTDGPSIYGFYFVQPPALDRSEGPLVRPRTARRRAAVKLMVANTVVKSQIKAWVRAIREQRTGEGADTGQAPGIEP